MTEKSDLYSDKKVVGTILAGGQSRMFGGGNKFFEKLGKNRYLSIFDFLYDSDSLRNYSKTKK